MMFRYDVKPRAALKIRKFYRNVARKYRHSYDEDDMTRNIYDALLQINLIETKLLRRKPTIGRWQAQGWHMAHAGTWYYAYTIDGDTVTIQDACHQQNMHEDDK